MFEKFTKSARHTVIEAQTQARRLGHDHIGTGHVLLALTTSQEIAAEVLNDVGITHDSVEAALTEPAPDDDLGDDDAQALESLGIDLEEVKRTVEASFGKGALSRPFSRKGHLPFTKGAKKTLELALREALQLGHNYIGNEHILLGLLRNNTSSASAMLTEMGADHDTLRNALLERLPKAS